MGSHGLHQKKAFALAMIEDNIRELLVLIYFQSKFIQYLMVQVQHLSGRITQIRNDRSRRETRSEFLNDGNLQFVVLSWR